MLALVRTTFYSCRLLAMAGDSAGNAPTTPVLQCGSIEHMKFAIQVVSFGAAGGSSSPALHTEFKQRREVSHTQTEDWKRSIERQIEASLRRNVS